MMINKKNFWLYLILIAVMCLFASCPDGEIEEKNILSVMPEINPTTVSKTDNPQQEVRFTIVGDLPAEGAFFRVYASLFAPTEHGTVIAVLEDNYLVLKANNGVPASTFFVTVTEPGKTASTRTALTVLDVPIGNVIRLLGDSIVVLAGQTAQPPAKHIPQEIDVNTQAWSSSDPFVAAVDPATGEISAVSGGRAKILLTVNDQYFASRDIIVVTTSTLPVLRLSILPWTNDSQSNANQDMLNRNNWRSTSVSLSNTGNPEWDFTRTDGQARGRGNSTWNNMGLKRPFNFRFPNSAWQSILGSGEVGRSWRVVANTIDFSHFRNFSAYFLGSQLSFDWTVNAWFAHVYFDNNRYWGVYSIHDELRDASEGRLNLNVNMENPSQSEFLLEWDRHPAGSAVRFHVSNNRDPFGRGNIPFNIDIPDLEDIPNWNTHPHFIWVRDFVTSVNTAITSRNFAEISNLIDLPTFVDMYLVNELFKNRDVGFSSMFFQVRQTPAGPRMVGGPIWDFDQTSGGVVDNQYTGYSPTDGPNNGAWAAWDNPWFRDLMEVPEFRQMVVDRWKEIRDNQVESMIRQIRPLAAFYQNCFNRNFAQGGQNAADRHSWTAMANGANIFRQPQTIRNLRTHTEQVDNLVNWFEQRRIWMDDFLQ
ncbi:MAG: CotH kinase family protein [Treponema sp.]|nr:CotH kinase family protein [Treponema sp.]